MRNPYCSCKPTRARSQAVVRRARTLSSLSAGFVGSDDSDESSDDDFATPRDLRQMYANHSGAELTGMLLEAAASGDGQYVRSLLELPRPDLDPNAADSAAGRWPYSCIPYGDPYCGCGLTRQRGPAAAGSPR